LQLFFFHYKPLIMAENQKERGNQGSSRDNQSGKSQRGLASADKETRERVAREGGTASHGGGRQSTGGSKGGGRS
jgi:hypothetical protein